MVRIPVVLGVMLLAGCGDAQVSDSGDDDVGSGADTDSGPASDSGCATRDEPLPELVPDAAGRLSPEPADEIGFVYDQGVLRTFEFMIAPSDLAFLDAAPALEQYVPATLLFEGVEYAVSVRYKGSIGAFVGCTSNSTPDNPFDISGSKTCPKLSLKVSFDEIVPDTRFFGVESLQFHAMNSDPSLMRERLGYGLFRAMGVPAPRAVHARVVINGELAGLFLNVEVIDGRFTRSRFADGGGNLYKEVWPTASAMQPQVDTARLLDGLRTNEDENPSVQRMIDFGSAVMADEGDAQALALATWTSVDATLRTVAVDRAIRADDGPVHFYCDENQICDNHNFYVYEEALADRIWLIPWDLDNAFVVLDEQSTGADAFLHVMSEWDDHDTDCTPRPDALGFLTHMPPSCDPLYRALGCHYHDVFDAATLELLEGPMSAPVVEAALDEWRAQIAGVVDEAHALDPEQLDPASWSVGLADLERRIDILRADAAARLSQG